MEESLAVVLGVAGAISNVAGYKFLLAVDPKDSQRDKIKSRALGCGLVLLPTLVSLKLNPLYYSLGLAVPGLCATSLFCLMMSLAILRWEHRPPYSLGESAGTLAASALLSGGPALLAASALLSGGPAMVVSLGRYFT